MATEGMSDDTSRAIERRQVDGWRQMSAVQRARTISGLSRAVVTLAEAGVRQRYPGASPEEVFFRRAVILVGEELAARAYPTAYHRVQE